MKIRFDADICTDLDAATNREWLEANGIGGFACGTISGVLTRRYHALLTAATEPPLGRVTMLSKFEETLIIGDKSYGLSTNRYPRAVDPDGYRFLVSFRLDPFPIWTYQVDGIELERSVFMVYGQNTVACQWQITGQRADGIKKVLLEIRPLISFVDYHHLQHETNEIDERFQTDGSITSIRPFADLPELKFSNNATSVRKTGYWYRNFQLAIEEERGFDFSEDLFQPFVMNFDLSEPAAVIASCGGAIEAEIADLKRSEIKRRAALVAAAGVDDDALTQLVLAADQFIVKRGDGHTVIAGYPWFSDWGRDTMISLTGLTITTNRPEIARGILLEFAEPISEGMLPNRFPDQGDTAEYNTVDATLWYFEAVRAFAEKTGDREFIKVHLYDKLVSIIDWHLRGTRYGIGVDTDGMLQAGQAGVQLTWMDAKIGDLVITPRTGKPVEIQALWYNALRIMSDLSLHFGKKRNHQRFDAMADMCEQSFNGVFWNEDEQCLFDVVDDAMRDGSVRPNQIFAASLGYSMLDDARARKVVDKVEAELLTPVGLRSLSKRDPRYCPIYIGSPFERDSAYHQGTVWGWLIGAFVDAHRRVYAERESRISEILSGLYDHLNDTGVGQISEIFDGDPPHHPRGCFAQAWSVAELLRVSVRES